MQKSNQTKNGGDNLERSSKTQPKLEFRLQKNKSAFLMILFGFLGFTFYFLLPLGYKIFAFILPSIALSMVFTHNKFHFGIFTLFLLVFLLFPSSIFTLDASHAYNFSLIKTQNYIENITNVIAGVIFVAIPIIALLASAWALYQGNVEQGISMLVKLFVVVLVIGIASFIFDTFNIPILGDIAPFTVMSETILKVITWLGNVFADVINAIDIFDAFPDLPNVPTNLSLDAGLNLQDFNLMVIGSFPIFLSLLCVVFGILQLITKWKLPQLKLTEKTYFSRPKSFNPVFLLLLGFVWICYFYYYLWIGEDHFLSFRTVGFYTIYLSIISGSLIISTFGGISYSKLSWKSLYGIILGNFAIFLFQNLFTQSQSLDAYQLEVSNSLDWNNIFAQVLAVAPAESFLFHIFTSGVYLSIIFLRYKRFNDKSIDSLIQKNTQKIAKLQLENEIYQIKLLKPKQTLDKTHEKQILENDVGDLDDYIKKMTLIQKLQNQNVRFEQQKSQDIDFDISQISQKEKFGLYFVVIFSNFLFSTMHCILLTPNGFLFNFNLFWASSLGLIYFLSGMVLSYISFKYGWITGIISHIINNTTIYAIILIGGLI